MRIDSKIRKLFYERIRIDEDGCWIWQGDTEQGKPVLYIDSEPCSALEVAFLLMDMPVPEGELTTHSALDVNPEHYAPKTKKTDKYREQTYADMGKTLNTGDIENSGD